MADSPFDVLKNFKTSSDESSAPKRSEEDILAEQYLRQLQAASSF